MTRFGSWLLQHSIHATGYSRAHVVTTARQSPVWTVIEIRWDSKVSQIWWPTVSPSGHTHTQTQQPVQLHPPATPPNGTHRSTLMKPANAIWIEMDRNASWKVFSWHTKSEWSFIRVLGLLASVAGCVWCVVLLQCMLPGFYAGILLMCCSSKRAIFPSCKLARSCFLGISLSPMLAL